MIVISLKKCDSMCKLVVSPIVSDVHFYRFPTVEPISKGEKKRFGLKSGGCPTEYNQRRTEIK